MKLVNENYEVFDRMIDTHFWIYNFGTNDIDLVPLTCHGELESNAYEIRIGNDTVLVPESYQLLIADQYYDKVDSIYPSDLLGNGGSFDTPVWSDEFMRYRMRSMEIVGYKEGIVFETPFIKSCYFIHISSNSFILVSESDLSNQLDKLEFSDIVVNI